MIPDRVVLCNGRRRLKMEPKPLLSFYKMALCNTYTYKNVNFSIVRKKISLVCILEGILKWLTKSWMMSLVLRIRQSEIDRLRTSRQYRIRPSKGIELQHDLTGKPGWDPQVKKPDPDPAFHRKKRRKKMDPGPG